MDNFDSEKKLAVVLGMHRSGTSAVTRGLKVLGVDLGDDLIPEADDNERGFWEDSEIVSFNDDLQAKLGYAWYGGILVDGIDWHRSDVIAAKECAKEILSGKLSKAQVFGLKDPRMAVLIEFWVDVFKDLGVSAQYLIVLRNPLAIAASLYKRNKIPKEKSLLLWIASVIQSLIYTRGRPRVVVSYDEMLKSPQKQLQRIAGALNFPNPDKESDEVKYYCDSFLTNELKHVDCSESELHEDADVLAVAADLYVLLNKVSTDRVNIESDDFDKWFDQIFNRYTELTPLLKYINHINLERLAVENALHAELDKLRHDIEDTQRELKQGIKNAHEEINTIQSTYSWKITKPLRLISRHLLNK